MTHAPIYVSVYDRFEHLQKSIESLLENKECAKTEIFISSDYPYKKEDFSKVNKVRAYINQIKGFKKVYPIFFDKNVGGFNASLISQKKIFSEYEFLIRLEDDCLTSNIFLEYQNFYLNSLVDDDDYFAVCGFNHGIRLMNGFKSNRFCPWGFGCWKSKLNKAYEFGLNFLTKKKIQQHSKFINSKGNDTIGEALKSMKHGYLPPPDYLYSLYCMINDKYNIFYQHNLVDNIGIDGSGQNCKISDLEKLKNVNFSKFLLEFDPVVISELSIENNEYREIFSTWKNEIKQMLYLNNLGSLWEIKNPKVVKFDKKIPSKILPF